MQLQVSEAGAEVFYGKSWYTVEGAIDVGRTSTYSCPVIASDKHGNVATKEQLAAVADAAQAKPAPE